MVDGVEFTPTEASRVLLKAMFKERQETLKDQFFKLYETEGDYRRAGSMLAHVHVRQAARAAVFGARLAGVEPWRGLWTSVCDKEFDAAMKEVDEIMASEPSDKGQSSNAPLPAETQDRTGN